MNDEWRLEVDFEEDEPALGLAARVEAGEVEHDLSLEFQGRVILSRDGPLLFVYAASREQIEAARDALVADSKRHHSEPEVDLRRWHPVAEEWRDPEEPLPETSDAERTERRSLMERERQAAVTNGYPEFEVRADLGSHHDAVAVWRRLVEEGLPAIHRWRYLVVGAGDEDNAKELRDRIEAEAPPGSHVKVEGTWQAVVHDRNPFARIDRDR